MIIRLNLLAIIACTFTTVHHGELMNACMQLHKSPILYIAHFDESEQFGQKRPPLSVTIKGILERYPDGQIFKVKRTAYMQYSSDGFCFH